jgi:ParB-like chromosome segregation protein Spo0J
VNVDRIIVTDRYRADLGDVSDLASSIAIHGLLHPIVVTTEGHLIAGQRRLEAVKLLGWTSVQVTYVENVTDAADLLRMERDENTCRKDMTASEKVALGRALEELERPKAKAAQAHGQTAPGRNASVPPNESVQRFDTREVVAPAVGMSTATYSRAKQLVTAAEQGDEIAAEQVAEMDRTGKVTPAYEAWKGERVNRGEAAPTRRDTFGLAPKTTVKKNVKNHKGRAPIPAMEGAINTLAGLTMPMKQLAAEDFAGLPDETRTRWKKELDLAMSTLRHVRELIKENPS